MQYETLLKSQLDWKCEEEENSYPHIKGIESKQRSDGASGKTCKMDCMWNTWNACPPALVDFFYSADDELDFITSEGRVVLVEDRRVAAKLPLWDNSSSL